MEKLFTDEEKWLSLYFDDPQKTATLFSLCEHSCGIIVTRHTLLGELGFPLWLQSASPL